MTNAVAGFLIVCLFSLIGFAKPAKMFFVIMDDDRDINILDGADSPTGKNMQDIIDATRTRMRKAKGVDELKEFCPKFRGFKLLALNSRDMEYSNMSTDESGRRNRMLKINSEQDGVGFIAQIPENMMALDEHSEQMRGFFKNPTLAINKKHDRSVILLFLKSDGQFVNPIFASDSWQSRCEMRPSREIFTLKRDQFLSPLDTQLTVQVSAFAAFTIAKKKDVAVANE